MQIYKTHLQPSISQISSKVHCVNVDPRIQVLADNCRQTRAEIILMNNPAVPHPQCVEVVSNDAFIKTITHRIQLTHGNLGFFLSHQFKPGNKPIQFWKMHEVKWFTNFDVATNHSITMQKGNKLEKYVKLKHFHWWSRSIRPSIRYHLFLFWADGSNAPIYLANYQVNICLLILYDSFFLILSSTVLHGSLDNCFIIHSAVLFSPSLDESS